MVRRHGFCWQPPRWPCLRHTGCCGRWNRGQAGDRGAWGKPPDDVLAVWHDELASDYKAMTQKWPELNHPSTTNHLGTLGTGNHFIEVCIELDQHVADPRVWIMLHS